MKNYITNLDKKTYMVFETGSGEQIDKVAQGMLDNNNIPGILPFMVSQFNERITAKYDITSLITVSELLDECIRKDKLIYMIDTILNVYSEAENYLIDPDSIILDCDKIFCDKLSGELFLIIMPVLDKNTGNPALNVFLKNLICRVKFDSTENCDYIGKMLGYLNSGKDFSLMDFRYIVAEQIGGVPVMGSYAVFSDDITKDSFDPVTDQAHQSESQKENEPVIMIKKPQTDRDDESIHEFKLPLDFYADDEDKEELKNKKSIFSKIFKESKNKNKSKKKEPDFSDEKLSVQYCDKNGEIIDEKEYDNSTVLLNSDNKSLGKTFLLRVKNNEKILLKGKSLRIGTEKKSVDYCIRDNCAVSRLHAEILFKNNSYFIIDNNSTNHTYINEKEIESKHEMKLQNKSRIRLADEEFVFYT